MALIRITDMDGLGFSLGSGMFSPVPISTGVRVIGIQSFAPSRIICLNGMGGALLGQGVGFSLTPSLMPGLDGFQGSLFGPMQTSRVLSPFNNDLDLLNSQTVTVYHYTSKEGLDGILSTRMIRASRDLVRDAFEGEGVYFTSLPPNTPKKTIIRNNWDNPQRRRKFEERCDYALEFQVPISALDRGADGRDVWIFRADFPIDDYPFKIHRNV